MTFSPLVDAHFHVYTRDMPIVSTAWHQPTGDAPIERYIAELDRHGVGFAVAAAASLYGDYNDYVIRGLRRHPRLRATALIRPEIDFYTLERMKADGVVGIRLFFRRVPNPPDLDSDEWKRTLRRVRDLDWHVHVLGDSSSLPHIIPKIEAAGVKLVIDHFGMSTAGEGINGEGFKAARAALDRGNTWIKMSAGFRMSSPEHARDLARTLVAATGGERLVWGSDWPFAAFEDKVTYADAVSALEDWVPDLAMRRLITGDTPMRLYFSS